MQAFVDAALYDPGEGFYATGGQAGRRGDFITAPEVGPLFGAVVSNAIDHWWRLAGEPGRFVVAEHGAGPGTLARSVTLAAGACLTAGALEWVLIERSDAQRTAHPVASHLRSVSSVDPGEQVDVVLANELLDNLPFGMAVMRNGRWFERCVDIVDGAFTLVDGDEIPPPPAVPDSSPDGTELPVATAAIDWVREQRVAHPDARIVLFDYAAPTEELVTRAGGWLRAFRDHTPIDDWLADPGQADITIDLPIEPFDELGASRVSQADFLREHGIDDLVAEGVRIWNERAGLGDLAALRARSRVTEAEALLDPAGMGGFTVFIW